MARAFFQGSMLKKLHNLFITGTITSMNHNSPKQSKICSVCGIRKPLDDFIVDPSKLLKEHSPICQKCRGIKFDEQSNEDEEGGGGKGRKLNLDLFAKQFIEELQRKWTEKQREKRSPDLVDEKEISEHDQTKADKTDQGQTEKQEALQKHSPSEAALTSYEDLQYPSEVENSDRIEASESAEAYAEKEIPNKKNVINSPEDSRSKYGTIFTATAFGNWARTHLKHIIRRESFSAALFDTTSTKSSASEKATQQTSAAQTTPGKQTINQTKIIIEEKTAKQGQTTQTTTEQEIIATNLFRTEKQQILRETAKMMPGGISQTATTTQMFERYAKIESPAIKTRPPMTPNEPSEIIQDRPATPKK